MDLSVKSNKSSIFLDSLVRNITRILYGRVNTNLELNSNKTHPVMKLGWIYCPWIYIGFTVQNGITVAV